MTTRTSLAAAGAAGALVAAGLLAATLPAHASTSGCSVSYMVQNQWPGGFTGNVSITNLGSPVPSWALTFDFPDTAQKVTQGWSATWSQSGTQVTAASMSWNGSLATNGSTTIGFNGSWSGTNPAPTDFALNGTPCTGAVISPSPSGSSSPRPARRVRPATRSRLRRCTSRATAWSPRTAARSGCWASTAPAASSPASRATACGTGPRTRRRSTP
ncbi:cellulose binding domain-containing protein [Streptacidiphilus monticola]